MAGGKAQAAVLSKGFRVDYNARLLAYPSDRTATGTLDECFNMCANGTLPGCVGFTRYTVHASDGNAGGTALDEVASCWWTAAAPLLLRACWAPASPAGLLLHLLRRCWFCCSHVSRTVMGGRMGGGGEGG